MPNLIPEEIVPFLKTFLIYLILTLLKIFSVTFQEFELGNF